MSFTAPAMHMLDTRTGLWKCLSRVNVFSLAVCDFDNASVMSMQRGGSLTATILDHSRLPWFRN